MAKTTPTKNIRIQLAREMIRLVSDKWTLAIMFALDGQGAVRFSDLHRTVGPVSQKMLAQTLRRLEKDGLVKRRVFPTVAPRVEYQLTPLGDSLSDATCSLGVWAQKYAQRVRKARENYRSKSGQPKAPWQTPAKP